MLKSDLHIHTLMSGHAFCTVTECVAEAKKRGLSLIAITDHGPAMEHSAHEGYFEMSSRFPNAQSEVNVLFGCEMNILNKNGDVDLSPKTMSELDIVLAGLHKKTPYTSSGEADNTNAIINAMMRHSNINVITHPFRSDFPISVYDVVQAANECNVILEINLSLLLKAIQQKTNSNYAKEIYKTAEMVAYLQSIGSNYIINSDAHHSCEIGISKMHFKKVTDELGINTSFVMNDNIDMINKFISKKKLW